MSHEYPYYNALLTGEGPTPRGNNVFLCHIQVRVFKLHWNLCCAQMVELLKQRTCLLFSENSHNTGSNVQALLALPCPYCQYPLTSLSGAVTSEQASLFNLQQPFKSSCQWRCATSRFAGFVGWFSASLDTSEQPLLIVMEISAVLGDWLRWRW